MDQPVKEIDNLIKTFATLGEMRVWSVLITIFGDAVAPRGGVVPATALQAILERLSIKPEAMRVSLHRLVKDDWITREKAGRQSFYRLTEPGEVEFLAATKRIYAKAPALTDPWQIVVMPPNSTLEDGNFIALGGGAYLGHALSGAIPEDALLVSGTIDAWPDWAAEGLGPKPLQEDYVRLESGLVRVRDASVVDALDATALRILAIHRWRRALLRHADVPLELLPEGWRGEACRALILEVHSTLSDLADPWLDGAIGPRKDLAGH